MTFKELRHELVKSKNRQLAIKWTQSGIVEVASLQLGGAIKITNVVSGKAYILPKMPILNIEILSPESMVTMGELLPKSK